MVVDFGDGMISSKKSPSFREKGFDATVCQGGNTEESFPLPTSNDWGCMKRFETDL